MQGLDVDEGQAIRDAEWLVRFRAAEAEVRSAQARALALLAEPEAVAVARRTGYGTTRRMVAAVLRVDTGEARTRVAVAEQLGPRRSLIGEPLPPRCPATAAAFAAGEISFLAARIVADALGAVPSSVHPDEVAAAEATLAGHARIFEPAPLAKVARHLVACLDPDGAEPKEPGPRQARELHIRPNSDGSIRLDGRLDAEGAAIVRTVVDSLNGRRADTDPTGPDERSLANRNADALVEACAMLLDASALPAAGGQRPHLVVTVALQHLIDGLGTATLDYGGIIDAPTARRLACDAGVVPVVLGGDSQPLDVGQAKRSATAAMRAALAARDGGCAFPGCDKPTIRCHAHHIEHYAELGPTCLSNLVLLCRYHHHVVHHCGWEVRIRDHHPEFIPPAHFDPDRAPIRNPLRQ